jgi:hypothetical protein
MTSAEHPWSECCVVACRRRSRHFPAGVEWICGRCYRKGPKAWRDRRARLGRKLPRTRNPADRRRIEWLRGRIIDRIIAVLNRPSQGPDMSPVIAEQLRKDGLL